MKLKYDIIALPIKFREEMNVVKEKFRVLYWKDYIIIELFNINSNTRIIDDIEIKSYCKKRIEQETIIIDGIETVGDVIYWDSFDGESLIEQIQNVVGNHDPTPIEHIDYDQELTDSINNATTLEELKTALVGGIGKASVKGKKK